MSATAPPIDAQPYDRPPDEDEDAYDMPPIYHSTTTNPFMEQVSPKVEITLSRRCKSRPVERPQDGVEHQFPAYVLASAKIADSPPTDGDLRNGVGTVRGTLQIPAREITTYTCNAEVTYAVHLKFASRALLKPIYAATSVYLPSGLS